MAVDAFRKRQLDSDIERIFDFLLSDQGPFQGTSEELAEAIGIPYDRLWSALNRIRSAEFISEQGWAIPNVPKGKGLKLWSIVDEADEEEALRDGFKVRAPEVLETMRRLQAQSALAVDLVDGRTRTGQWWKLVNSMAAAVVSAGEIMLFEVEPNVRIGTE